jgi:hypothetical protein
MGVRFFPGAPRYKKNHWTKSSGFSYSKQTALLAYLGAQRRHVLLSFLERGMVELGEEVLSRIGT